MVRGEYVNTGVTDFEGALQYLIVQRRDTGARVVEREYRDRVWLNDGLAPGRYRLVSYTRSCAGSCPPQDPTPCTDAWCPSPGGLDSQSDRCAINFDLRRGLRLKALIAIGAGRPCRIGFSPHHVTTPEKAEADRIIARDLRRYLRRNALLAPWYHALWRIEATRGVIAVRPTLRETDLAEPQHARSADSSKAPMSPTSRPVTAWWASAPDGSAFARPGRSNACPPPETGAAAFSLVA